MSISPRQVALIIRSFLRSSSSAGTASSRLRFSGGRRGGGGGGAAAGDVGDFFPGRRRSLFCRHEVAEARGASIEEGCAKNGFVPLLGSTYTFMNFDPGRTHQCEPLLGGQPARFRRRHRARLVVVAVVVFLVVVVVVVFLVVPLRPRLADSAGVLEGSAPGRGAEGPYALLDVTLALEADALDTAS